MASATRMNTPIENVPQTINVVNANLLRDLDAYSFDQAVRYTPGVTQRQNAPDGSVVRGLAASTLNHYEDGYYAPPVYSDMAAIDRIEIIKGPSASIAGASESTGFLNYITKKPQYTDQQYFSATIGTWDSIRAYVDSTGPIPIPGYGNTLAYRIIATYMNSDTYRDFDTIKKTGVYPSFAWKATPTTDIAVKVDLVDNVTPGGYETFYFAPTYGATATKIAVPANAKVQLNQFGPLDVNSSWPGMNRRDQESAFFIAVVQQIGSYLTFRQSANYYTYSYNRFYNALSDNMVYDANGNLDGTFQVNRGINSQQAWRFQGDLAGHDTWLNNNISLRALVGYELARTRGTNMTYLGANTAIPINLLQPDYSQDIYSDIYLAVHSNTKGGAFGYFGNAQLGFLQDRVIFTGGVRVDENKASWTLNDLNGVRTNTPTTPTIKSPMGGLTIKPLKWLALFGVYSDAGAAASTISTFPGIPTTDPRQLLVAITPDTKNKEFGAKLTFFNGNLSIDASHFDTRQDNIVRGQTDPSVPGGSQNFVDSGNRSYGYEYDFAGDVTRRLSVYGGYVNDKTSAPGFKPYGGNLELRGTPRDKVQAFARYRLFETPAAVFAVKAGVVHQTAVYGRASDTYNLPGATRYDVGFDYTKGKWSIAAGILNVTNVIFPAFAVGQGSNTIDDPRNFYGTVGYHF